jgi:CRISPR-associated protein Csb1
MAGRQIDLNMYDEWLKDESNAAAIVMRQLLEPVGGRDSVIFPPTYAPPQGKREEEWMGYNLGYNIDRFSDGHSVCQIDSVGSQANRMEPIFKKGEYSKLTPQVVIKARDREINLLDVGHRAADAIVRFSTLSGELKEAFSKYQDGGNAEILARIAPTSIVFGSWDSRGTMAKLPRIVGSVIRAYDVDVLHRSAQYSTIAGEIIEGGEAEITTSEPKADSQKAIQKAIQDLGLAHAPAVGKHGGVRVKGDIRRDATLNLTAIRALKGTDSGMTLKLRRYILGLALVAITWPQETFLREGCQLVPDQKRSPEWHVVLNDGSREAFNLPHRDALNFALMASEEFGVGPDREGTFDSKKAKQAISDMTSKEKKKSRQSSKEQADEGEK